MIRLVFLGRLADLAGRPERDLPAPKALSLTAIIEALEEPLSGALSDNRIKVALNGCVAVRDGLMAGPGDELAFLPPVSGG